MLKHQKRRYGLNTKSDSHITMKSSESLQISGVNFFQYNYLIDFSILNYLIHFRNS